MQILLDNKYIILYMWLMAVLWDLYSWCLFSSSSSFPACCSSSSAAAVGCKSNAVNGICWYPFLPTVEYWNPIGWHKSSRQLGGGVVMVYIPATTPLPIPTGCSWHDSVGEEVVVSPEAQEISWAAGVVPDPVAAMIEGSAWRSSHSMVSPSDRWPSSRVSWKIRAAQRAGIRTRRPRPFTLVWRSLEVKGTGFRRWVLGVDSPASEELRLELVRLEVAENLWNAISELIAKLNKRFRFFIKKNNNNNNK